MRLAGSDIAVAPLAPRENHQSRVHTLSYVWCATLRQVVILRRSPRRHPLPATRSLPLACPSPGRLPWRQLHRRCPRTRRPRPVSVRLHPVHRRPLLPGHSSRPRSPRRHPLTATRYLAPTRPSPRSLPRAQLHRGGHRRLHPVHHRSRLTSQSRSVKLRQAQRMKSSSVQLISPAHPGPP